MIVNQTGKPYSKRDGDFFAGDFKERGFSADALLNYLALLGWSPGEDREKMSRLEMIESFSLDRVKSSAAQMDIRKLTHLNGQYVAEMALDQFASVIREKLSACDWAGMIEEGALLKVCELMQSRTHLYSYAVDWKYFFSDDFEYDEKGVRKCLMKEGIGDALGMLRGELRGISFSCQEIGETIRSVERSRDIREGKLNQPIRVAVTGRTAGAGICETMEVLGQETVMARLGRAVEMVDGA
jgi:glutamyl/glutaminyl-tRNA synthetase